MKIINQISLTFLLVVVFGATSYATWSIVVVDAKTKEIGIAGASCTYSVYGIGAIIPSKGAIVVQAMSNSAARMKGLQMMLADAPPEQILKAMQDPMFDPEEQQYAIVCVNFPNRPLTFTGKLTTSYKGALTAEGVSVQGNTLTNPDELQEVLNAALKAQKDSMNIEDVLMLALEAGAKYGGDKRCGSIKASSAFLTVAKPGDVIHRPFLNLVINGTDDKVNAVEALRLKFDNWKNKQGR